jgi:cell division protein FtsI (penicillin-binding protein 3)
MNVVKNLKKKNQSQERNFNRFDEKVALKYDTIPNVKGMSGMDAVTLLENLGIKVKAIGVGKVKKQSLNPGVKLDKSKTIILELS